MKPLLFRLLLVAVLSLTGTTVLRAHVDTIIRLKGTTLTGLPKNYAPAELDMNAFRLRIGNREMTFFPLLKSLCELPHDLSITASWYHESGTLPPYLSLRIQPKGKDFSYSVLFDLDTLDVIKLSVTLQESESTSRILPVALSDRDKKAIRESIKVLK
jgi:hypothetical protein